MDPITLLIGGGLVVAGWAAGRIGRRRAPKAPKAPKFECSCGHGYGSHRDGKACQADQQRAAKWSKDGFETGYEWVRCPCLAYDGPEPMPRIADWTPPPTSLPPSPPDRKELS